MTEEIPEVPKEKKKRGPPKGTRYGGRKKGVPNHATKQLKELAREYTDDALRVLGEILANAAEPAQARISAAKELLDRGYGRSVQPLANDPDNPLVIQQNVHFFALPANNRPDVLPIVSPLVIDHEPQGG